MKGFFPAHVLSGPVVTHSFSMKQFLLFSRLFDHTLSENNADEILTVLYN